MSHSRTFRLRIALCGAVFLLAATAVHPGPQEGQTPTAPGGRRGNLREFLGLGPPPDPVAAERGARLYGPNCALCHGAKARGAEGPNLIRSVMVLHDERGELIGPFLLKGRPENGMPGFPALTESQTYDLAQFLHLQVELAANRGLYQRLNVVNGDARKGEAWFNGPGGCTACHSITGDLAGIGGKYAPDVIQTRLLWPDANGAGAATTAPRKATVTLAGGERVTGTLKRLDDFHVSLYDASGRLRSWSREGGRIQVEVEDRLRAHRELLGKYTDEIMHDLTAYLVTLK